jgi:hypothetical protein
MENKYVVALLPPNMPDDNVQELLKEIFKQHPFKMVALKVEKVPTPVLGWADFPGDGKPF